MNNAFLQVSSTEDLQKFHRAFERRGSEPLSNIMETSKLSWELDGPECGSPTFGFSGRAPSLDDLKQLEYDISRSASHADLG